MAGGIAHEFNNLLMGISGYAEALQMKLGDEHSEQETIKGLLHCVDSASLVVGQLLAFGRRQEMDVRPVELNLLTSSITSMLQRLTAIYCDQAILSPETVAQANPNQIEQVLVNLTLNRDAMPHGAITITVANRSIDQGTSVPVDLEPGDYAELSVSDTGAGMDEATIDRLRLFYDKSRENSTGLGCVARNSQTHKRHNGDQQVGWHDVGSSCRPRRTVGEPSQMGHES